MWNRRHFFKLAIAGMIGMTGSYALLKWYKRKNNIVDIVAYPDPILRGVSEPIEVIDDSIRALADNMVSICQYHAPFAFFLKGALYKGLAAPQIGVNKRMIICGLYGEIRAIINPEILEKSGAYPNSEYCLSLPQQGRKIITRSQYVRVRYRTLDNKQEIMDARNSYAALLEHEIDHLNGILYIDYA